MNRNKHNHKDDNLDIVTELNQINMQDKTNSLNEISDIIIHNIPISTYLSNELGYYHAKATLDEKSEKVNCPIHHEKSPSFFYNDKNGFYHCFGCGAKGTVVQLHQTITEKSYYESIMDLIKIYKLEDEVSHIKLEDKKKKLKEHKRNRIQELRKSKSLSIDENASNSLYIQKVIRLINNVNLNSEYMSIENKIKFYELVDKVLIYGLCNDDILNKIKKYM